MCSTRSLASVICPAASTRSKPSGAASSTRATRSEVTARSDIAYHPVDPPIPVGSDASGTGVDGCLSTPSPYDAIQALVGRSATSTTQKGSKRPLLLNTDREIEVPAAYDGLLPLPAEQADRGGGEREQCACV